MPRRWCIGGARSRIWRRAGHLIAHAPPRRRNEFAVEVEEWQGRAGDGEDAQAERDRRPVSGGAQRCARDAEDRGAGPGCRLQFFLAGQISTDQLRAISILTDLFARNLTHNLAAWLRTRFQVNLVSAEQILFSEFLLRIPEISYVASVRMEPLGALAVLQLDLAANTLSEWRIGGQTLSRAQPNAFSSGGTTQVVQQTTLQATDKPVNRIDLKEGATVEDLVQELQRTGAGARDVISILQAMKEAGALEAGLEVL